MSPCDVVRKIKITSARERIDFRHYYKISSFEMFCPFVLFQFIQINIALTEVDLA